MEHSLRIAFFLGSFPLISETFILRQITGLIGLGHQVDIYADTRSDLDSVRHPEVDEQQLLARTTYMDMPPECAPWELPVRPFTGKTWIPGAVSPVSNLLRLVKAMPVFLHALTGQPKLAIDSLRATEYGFQADSLSVLYRLVRLLDRPVHYDILHAHFGPNGNSFRFARELWRAPLVVSFHGYDFTTLPRKHGAGIYRKLFDTADVFTANSQFTRDRVLHLGCPPDKIKVLPVGLGLQEFPFKERKREPTEPFRIITVARLVEIKGYEFILGALAKVRDRLSGICYDIVGDGPLRTRLEQLINQLELSESVKLHGALDRLSLRPLLDQAHLFVLGSVTIDGDQEGQGLALQEAQACGLPVIATQHGALPEGFLPGESGFLVPERDAEALAERIIYLVEHPEIWNILGAKGRAYVEKRYDIHKLNQELVRLYENMLANFRLDADSK